MPFKYLTKIVGIIFKNDGKVRKVVWERGKESRSSVGMVLVSAGKREL
jgi:preprotein translocase subunit SecE